MPFNVPEEEKPKFNKGVQRYLVELTEGIRQRSIEATKTDYLPSYFDSIREPELPEGSNPLDYPPLISDPQTIFSTPLNEDKIKALGFVDEDFKPSEAGELFYNLTEAGMFDANGVLTDKAKDYLVKPEDIGKPENIDAFITQFDDGLIRDEATFSQIKDNVWNFGRDALYGVGNLIEVTAKRTYSGIVGEVVKPEAEAAMIAGNLAFLEGQAANLAELNRMGDVGLAWLLEGNTKNTYADPYGLEDTSKFVEKDSKNLYLARQRQFETRRIIADAEVGELAEFVTGLEGGVEAAEWARATMGKKAFDEKYKNIRTTNELVGGVENLLPIGVALKFAKIAPTVGRAELTAQRIIANKLSNDIKKAATETSIEAARETIRKGDIATNLAKGFVDKAAEAGASPAVIERGRRASEILTRTTKATEEAAASIPELTAKLDELTKTGNLLSNKIPVKAAEATVKAMEAGRKLRALPANAIGSALERFGNTLTKIDSAISGFLSERGLDKMYTAALGAGGVIGLAGNPVVGAIAGGAAALKAGKVINNYGKLFKYVGKTMAEARGQIPFWQRVASHTEPGSLNRGIAHTFNMLDLGGVTSDTLRRIPRGVAASYPVDLMFEWLSDGADMRPQTFLQAGAESLFINGSFSAAGGAFMGTREQMRQNSIGDQVNFLRNMTDDKQKALYNTLPSGVRRAVATYSIANPTLNYVFKDSGPSNYDPNTNTAAINVNSNNPIRPLIAHETLHHTIIKNNMEGGIAALFLGDTVNNTVGGLLRSRDGKLDSNFEKFRDRYYQRLGIAGMTDAEKNAIYPLEKIAVEYFIEQHSDQYAAMAESGELGAIAASGDIKRKLSGVLETVLPRIPVLRDLHFKSGGMIDKDGGWVTGNGILDADGVRTNPITNKMFREMNRRSSGRAPGQFDPLISDKQDSGAQITLDPTNAIDSELLHPLIKVDDNGNPVLVNGKPVALDKATLLERALAGLTVKEVLRRKKAENYIPEKGEAHIDDFGEFNPGWLSNDVLAEIFAKNRLNPEQKRIIREINRMIRKGDGGRAVMINFPATTRNKSGKAVYKPQGATLRDTVPVAIIVSKDGNLLFGLMSVTKLHENIQKRAQSRRGKKLYGGNVDLILRDTQAMMQFHKDGVDSIEYFKSKYGAVEADERKKFINTMFGLLNQKEQAVLNPMLIEDNVKSRDNVYRTYRADRVSKAVAMSPDDYPAMPFNYEAVSQVKMPEQARQMPEKRVAINPNQSQESPNERQPSPIQTESSRASTGGSKATGERLREQGGLPRGPEQLQSQDRPGDPSVPLIGLPATVKVPGIGKYTFGPNETARNVAAEYARSAGIDYNPPKTYAKVDEARATRIAEEYEKMVHAPNDPKVKESYDAMIRETLDQWEAIKKTGLVVEPIPIGAKDPYAASPRLAIIDVKDNNHLWFFTTDNGFGGTESAGIDISGNPLMKPTGEVINGHTMLANDVFRIVHDYFGHIKEGVGFRADGEENAWRSHSAMYSDKARPAMTAETRGQNSWVNYGPFSEFNKTADAASTQYAPQKTGILPDWVMSEGASDIRYMPDVAVVPERFTGSADDINRRGKYVEPPQFFKRFNIDSYERGGRFFDAASGEDLTGKQYSTGSIDVSTGRPKLSVDNISQSTPTGNKFKTNLFKQSAGWKWTSENPPPTSTIVSVEGKGKHIYTLKANFESGVELTRYSEKASEPRLRPTAYGELKLGEKIGEISIRGKAHPVYESVGIIPKVKDNVRQMPESVSPEDLTPVANKIEAQRLFADGKRIFAVHELDEVATEITSLDMLNSYSTDVIGYIDSEDQSGVRYMPEKIDAEYMKAVESGDVEAQQRMVDEAARAAGYFDKGYHRTKAPITEFKPGGLSPEQNTWRTKDGELRTLTGPSGKAIWFGTSPDNLPANHNVRKGQGVVISVFLKNPKPLQIDEDTRKWATEVYADGSREFPFLLSDEHIQAIRRDGYSGIQMWDQGKTSDEGNPSEVIVFDPNQIKSADPIVKDDSGNIIPPSQRFNPESKDIRYMPEPMKKPYGPNDPLPSFESTVVRGETKMKGFKWDKPTNVVYDIGNKKTMSFSFDPAYLVKPKFGDPEKLIKGQAVIMLEADKARATGGDMGGVNYPNLRSNQVSVTGPDGIKYRVKWANMTSTFVSGTKNRMQLHGAKYALIQLMDDFALKSNKRTARTLDAAMKEANLTNDQNNMIAMAMYYGIIVGKKAKLSTAVTQLKNQLKNATQEEKNVINNKIKSALAERDALNPSDGEMDVYKAIANVKTAMSNVATGRWQQITVDNAFNNLQALKETESYKNILSRIKSPYVYDNIGKTFTDRGAAIGSITSIKLGSFDVKKIMMDSSDFKEAKNLDIVASVELSQNPDFFALYFGKDPVQEAAMSSSERAARDQMLANNDFQVHESYDWAMIGPVDGNDFIFNKPVRPETIFKNYRSVHEKASVKKGSEETVAGAMRKNSEYKLTAFGDTIKITSAKGTQKVKKTK